MHLLWKFYGWHDKLRDSEQILLLFLFSGIGIAALFLGGPLIELVGGAYFFFLITTRIYFVEFHNKQKNR